MIITHITITNFKPMMHGGIHRLDIDITSDTLCVIGNNGSGKSTLLGELHPFPAISSNYASEGGKCLHLTHNEHTYIVSSNFYKKEIRHSFVKDGKEINLSGTSGVQTELCYKEFNINGAIKTLLNGVVDLGTMVVTNRKKFLMSCYPTDLSFVLEQHQQIKSKLTAVKTNLKMLHNRLGELEQKTIPEEAYALLHKTLEELDGFKQRIIKAQTLYEAELSKVVSDSLYDPDAPALDTDCLNNQILSLCKRVSSVYRQNPKIISEDCKKRLVQLETSKHHLQEQKTTVGTEIEDIVHEINRFEQLSKEVAADHVMKQSEYIFLLEIELAHIVKKIDPKLPILDGSLKIDINQLKEIFISLSQYNQILSPSEFQTLEEEVRQVSAEVAGYQMEISYLKHQQEQLVKQLEGSKLSEFKLGCIESCPARENAEKTQRQYKKELTGLTDKLLDISEKLKKGQLFLQKNKTKYDENKVIQPWVIKALTLLEPLNLKNCCSRIIKQPVDTLNYITRLFENQEFYNNKINLQEELRRASERLHTMQLARTEKQELLKKLDPGKGDRLDTLRTKYAEIKEQLDDITIRYSLYSKLNECTTTFEHLEQSTVHTIQVEATNRKAKWLSKALEEIAKILRIVEDEQLNIKTSIKQQESIQIRIHQEIKPNIEELSSSQERLLVLEKALSPINGIPHEYMVNFMNQVIHYANIFIQQVWNYDMELLKLNVDEPMDYSFPVQLFGDSVLKDISWLSRAQTELVNVAINWALFKVMDLGTKYPMKLDEADAGFTPYHRTKLLELLSGMVGEELYQLILVNHHNTLFSGFANAQICVLSEEGIALPAEYNQNIKIN